MAETKINPLYPNDTGTFTVKTVQGTGTRAEFVRIADDLVQGSRLYRHLCRKIFKAKHSGGLNRYHKERYLGMYKEVMKEFSVFEREANKILKAQDLKIKKLEATIKKRLTTINTLTGKLHYQKAMFRRLARKNKDLTSKNVLAKNVENFFTKKLRWHQSESHMERAEIMLRSIIAYNELQLQGKTNFWELIVLAIGTQMDAFNRSIVTRRFGKEFGKSFNRQIHILVTKGYIRKFDRRQYYYITEEGKQKWKEVMSTVYGKQYGFYWKRIFTEEKE